MSLKISYKFAKGEFDEAMREVYAPIAEAGTAAIREAAGEIKTGSRASIAAAGFSKRWQNALRADVYPKKGKSANAAAHIYHKIPYAEVFETGATIQGNPLMWLPMRGLPTKLARKKLTPERFATEIGDLTSLNRPGQRPLLMASMRVSEAEAKRGAPYKIRMSALIRGATRGTGTVVQVPVFVGVDTVKVGRKFDVYKLIKEAAAELPDLYLKHLKVD